jgi:four helix bundle protein
LADDLVFEIYDMTRTFPVEERFGLQGQIRRAAVSTATNIVEGCAYPTTREYCRYLQVAFGSATETRYLVGVASRVGLIPSDRAASIDQRLELLVRRLHCLVQSLRRLESNSRLEP